MTLVPKTTSCPIDSRASVPIRIWPPTIGNSTCRTIRCSASESGGMPGAVGASLMRCGGTGKSVPNTVR
jgi:hypothetical protein